MPADLLFEIGCEEIPAKMLAKALAELPAAVGQKLTAARLAHGSVRVLGTPRRLAVIVKQLVDRQPDLNEQVVGPPVSAAYAADGTLTKAGQGFAAKNGVDPKKYMDAYNSFSTQSEIQRDKKLLEDYKIDGVPTLAVQGKYETGPAATNSLPGTIQVLDYLVAQVRAKKM